MQPPCADAVLRERVRGPFPYYHTYTIDAPEMEPGSNIFRFWCVRLP